MGCTFLDLLMFAIFFHASFDQFDESGMEIEKLFAIFDFLCDGRQLAAQKSQTCSKLATR
jgi:hypothetical protein